jgi:taurine--2-oxoglutarate transaminase
LVSAQGVHVQDAAGRDYLDFSSMLVNVNIGHQHPRVIQAIKGQAGRARHGWTGLRLARAG